MSRIYVFNGWAAEEDVWGRCRFRRDRIFNYLEHLDGVSLSAVAEEPGPFVLVGFSMGSSIALQAVLEHPEKVQGLVLVSGTARMMEERAPAEQGGGFVWQGMSPRRWEAFRTGVKMLNEDNPSPLFDDVNLDRGLEYLKTTDQRAALTAIAGRTHFPVAIFQSRRDGIVRPHNAEFLHRIFPQASLNWIESNEHDLPRTVPRLIDEAVSSM